MSKVVLCNALIVNEGKSFTGGIVINNELIETVFEGAIPVEYASISSIDIQGKLLIPGVIDDQVHFRDPGLTHKGDLYTESKAAVAGGVTSFMDMPNVKPQTTTIELLNERNALAASKSFANYSFYLGATNDNLSELEKIDQANTCGVKIFMGSSTGNMLVDNTETLQGIFQNIRIPIAVHCEDEPTVQANLAHYKAQFGDAIPIAFHPVIRSAEACYRSSAKAVELASKYGAHLHILHLSTAKEMTLLDNSIPASEKKITAEVCVHHLWFDDRDYATKGALIKWNPAIKAESDKLALFEALLNNKIDVVATDHAPHLMEEKNGLYTQAMSGGPLVQHSLLAMLEFYHQGKITIEKVVEKMCHTPADIFKVSKRGYLKPGYFADIAIVDLHASEIVTKQSLLYKCGWSPFEGQCFHSKVEQTYVNGTLMYDKGIFNEEVKGRQLTFNR
jgi:dihydroorotase